MPNTINSKTGLYKVPLTIRQFSGFSYDELIEYAKKPRRIQHKWPALRLPAALYFKERVIKQYRKQKKAEKPGITYEIPETKQELLPCIQKILEDGAVRGARNNTLIILTSCLLQSGYKLEETEEIVRQWNQLNEPPLSGHELDMTVRSAWTMLQNGRRYGCSSIKELGLCSSNTCRLGEQAYGNRDD